MKKILSLVAICLMAVTSAFADDSGDFGTNLHWDYNSTSKTLTISNKTTTPEEMPVYEYGNAPWYSYRTDLTTLNVGENITTISSTAFLSFTALTSVTLPESLKSVGASAFDGCDALSSVTLPESVESIGNSAFSSCDALSSVTLSKSLKTVGRYAFSKLYYPTINFKSYPEMDSYAFYYSYVNVKNLALEDGSYIETSTTTHPSFTTNPTYTRQLAAGQTMGTLVLPFAIKNNSDDYTLGHVTDASVYGITVSNYADDEEIAANTPILFKAKTAGAKVVFTATGTDVSASATMENSSTADNWITKGTYTAITATQGSSDNINNKLYGNDDTYNQIYYIGTDDNFYWANMDFPASTFRGWLVTSDQRPADASAKLAISWDDDIDVATGVNSIDANVNANRGGKYIENNRVVILKNGKKFNVAGQQM